MSHRSRGCLRCRQRRVKCDRGRPSCQRCLARNELCVGYRDEADLLFQNETDKVVFRSKTESVSSSSPSARGRKTQSRSAERPPVTGPLDTSTLRLPPSRPWLKAAPAEGKSPSLEDQVASTFIDKYVIYPCNESSSPGFLEHLPCLFAEVNVEGRFALRWAVQAAAFADLSREPHNKDLAPRALECYGQALNALGKSLAEKGKVPDDHDLMVVVVLDIFETLFMPQAASIGSHTQGMAHILRLRGHKQFYDPRGWGLFRLAHHRLQKQQLAKQLPPLSESRAWLDSLNEEMASVRLEKDALEVSTICQRATAVLQSLTMGEIELSKFLELFPEMKRLDQETVLWRNNPEWSFRTLKKSEIFGDEEVIQHFPADLQLHKDVWMAYEWNYHRTARIILHQKLLACLRQAMSMPNTQQDVDAQAMMRDEESSSRIQIEILADEVLATVPQTLGDIDHLGRCLPDPSKPPRCRAIGAYLLLWPVKIIQAQDGASTTSQKIAARAVFERIREYTGMKSNLGALSII